MTIPLHLLFSPPGGWEWVIILVVVLIFFGNRIPNLARSLGSGITEFKHGLKEGESDPDSKPSAKDSSSESPDKKA